MIYKRLSALLGKQKTRDFLKATLATLLSSLLMLVTPIRQAVGSSYYMILLVSGCAHAGKTIGANIELQIQQLLVSACVWSYILIVQAIVYAVRNRENFDTEVDLIHGFALGIFCFATATAYAYLPRLNVAIKLNLIAPISSMTVIATQRWHYNVQPLPSIIYAQLLGIGISTLVNIFVWPSTSSHKLAQSFEELLREMAECCEFFHSSVSDLGTERSSTSTEAVDRRKRIQECVSAFGETVGGSAYEITIGRFPQDDYRRMFVEANHLAEEFCGLCLPFEIDREFLGKLDDTHQAENLPMPDASPLLSRRIQRATTNMAPAMRRGSVGADEWLSIVQQGAELSVAPVRELLELHQRVFLILIDRFVDLQKDTATKALLWLLTRQKADVPEYAVQTTGGEFDDLEVMSLAQIADYLDKQAAHFEVQETVCIRMIGPYQRLMDEKTFNQYTVLMSFIGALRENSTAISRLLRLVDEILQKRPMKSRVWFPQLSIKWLLLGQANDLANGEFGPEEMGNNLETAYETDESTPELDAESKTGTMDGDSTDDEQMTMDDVPRPTVFDAASEFSVAVKISKRFGWAVFAYMSPYILAANTWFHQRQTQYALKFTLAMLLWGIWAYIGVTYRFFVRNYGNWGLTAIAFVFNVTVGSTLDAGIKRLVGTVAAGLWAIVTWKASQDGSNPYYSYICISIFCVSIFIVYFYIPRWSACWMVMTISYSQVFFSAYFIGPGSDGSRMAWIALAVNAIAIVYVMLFSNILAPYKARKALQKRLAKLLRLNSFIARSVTFLHVASNEFPVATRIERQRIRRFMYKFRVVVQQSRALYTAAKEEPSIHGRFKAKSHRQLIDMMETQMEWWLYSHAVDETDRQGAMTQAIRATLPMREDIIGAQCLFNHALALALYTNTRLPTFLPNAKTARYRFVRDAQPLLFEKHSQEFAVTSLCRWSVGIWHIVAVQSKLCELVSDIVGRDTESVPTEIDDAVRELENSQGIGLPMVQGGGNFGDISPEDMYGDVPDIAPLLNPDGSRVIGQSRGGSASKDGYERRWFKYIH